MVIFILKSSQFSFDFHDNSNNKNRKINFAFVSAHYTSSIKTGSKKRWRVCISLVGKYPGMGGREKDYPGKSIEVV